LNTYLEGADIGFLKDGLEPVVFSPDRTLRRYFSIGPYGRQGAFERNERLYGGFWLNLKRERRVHIRIDAERVCLLDFSSMFVRLAYAQVGVEPPEGDLYDLTGFLRGYDNEQHRDGVKQGFNSLLNGGKAGHRDILDELPKGTSARAFRDAVAKKHPALSRLFKGQPVGLSLMFTESRILLRTLKTLMEQNVVGLGLHDGLLVAHSKSAVAEVAMREAALEVCGAELPLKSTFL